MSRHVLVVRLDSAGDVLLAGPAIRAVAAGAEGHAAVRAARARRRPSCCPASTRSLVWRAPWIDPEPDAGRPRRRRRAGRAARRARRSTEARDLRPRSTSPRCPPRCCCGWPACRGSARRQRRLPGLAARRPAPRRRRPARGRARRCRSPPRPASRCRPATTAGCASRPRRRARRRSPGRYVVVHPGRVACRRGRWAAGAQRASWSTRSPPPGTGCVVTGGPGERALTALVAGARGRRPRRADDLAELAGVLAGADARGGRQHRAGAPGRGGRHAGGVAVRADRPGRPVAPVRGAARAARRRGRAVRRHPRARAARCPATRA